MLVQPGLSELLHPAIPRYSDGGRVLGNSAQSTRSSTALYPSTFQTSHDFPLPSPTLEAQVCIFLPGSRLSRAFLVSPADKVFEHSQPSRQLAWDAALLQPAPSIAPSLITDSGASSPIDASVSLATYRFPTPALANADRPLVPSISTVNPELLVATASDPISSPPKPAPGYVFPDPASAGKGKSTADTGRVLTDRRNSQILFKLGARISPKHKQKPRCDGGKARHVCIKCKASFTRGHDLRRHLALHSGDTARAFSCHMCSKAFPRKDALKRHLETRGTHSDSSRKAVKLSMPSASSATSSPQLTLPPLPDPLTLPPMPSPLPAHHNIAWTSDATFSMPGTLSGYLRFDNLQVARLPISTDFLNRY